jgi:hypothetical protein
MTRAGGLRVSLLASAATRQTNPQPRMHLADSGEQPEVTQLGFARRE